MFSVQLFSLAALVSLASAHSQILNAQGIEGSPSSVGFQVGDIPRNCTAISPCQQDACIIRDAEITANIANECGRTQLTGNIDVGENTENALAANSVTQVAPGGELTVTIHQVNADGAGPYTCDMDPTGNTLGATGQTPLTVTNNVPGANGFSQAKTEDFNITITMPDDLKCTGGSTGNICTVRCRNNSLAGPFGGCFAVQQADAEENTNVASEIGTKDTEEGIKSQTESNNKDLDAALANNQDEGTDERKKASSSIAGVLPDPVIKESPVQTPDADAGNNNANNNEGNNKNGKNNNGNNDNN